ncbi:MAG: Kelch repeat-containing protein [Gemmatimonadales bacterium]
MEIGTWAGAAGLLSGRLTALGQAHAWLGLQNSDDIGTFFDVRVEVYRNAALVVAGETLCLRGISRNASSASDVVVSFPSFTSVTFGPSDVLSIRQLARIGTNGIGGACGGHNSAAGVRSYFDATSRAASVSITLAPVDQWNAAAPLPTARFGLGIGAVGGKLYAIGGQNLSAYLGTVEAYDPIGDSWTILTPMPTARSQVAVGVIDGFVYVAGGANGGVLNTLERYDPVSGTWVTKSPMPSARYLAAGGVLNAIFYVVGGRNGAALSILEAYDPSTDTWTAKAPMPTPRDALAVGVINGLLYAVGGTGLSSVVEAYDPATDSWSTKASMPTPRSNLAMSALNGLLYAVGGVAPNAPQATALESYDPASDTWATKASMPTARNQLATGVLSGVLYAVGGYDGSPLTANEAYQP